MAAPVDELAPAKINLSLRVLGRRPDGYHELESLVAFAAVGDRLTLYPGNTFALTVTGPFAAALDGENLVAEAVHRARAADPQLEVGTFVLEKNLPVAAGVGGGSADAAAALRALQRANRNRASLDWPALAAALGADVPVCLANRPALMCGIGERLHPVARLPRVPIVLVNPRLPLGAGEVFRALNASPLQASAVSNAWRPPSFAGLDDLVSHLQAAANDLEAPAKHLCPVIGRVQATLAAQSGARLVRMSGSGPTCFALFDNRAEAESAATIVAKHEPGWWVVATEIAGT